MIASVSGIFIQQLQRIHVRRPDNRIASDTDGRRLSDSALRQLIDGFIRQGPGAGDDADVAFFVNASGMMPIFALPGEITPGQFGPMSVDFECLRTLQTLTISLIGMPSVMQMMRGMPASFASRDCVCCKWRPARR